MAQQVAHQQGLNTTTSVALGQGLQRSAGICLPPGLRCRYKSDQHGWISAQILRLHHSDGTYDLDVRQRASADKIAPVVETGLAALSLAWPHGSLVFYRSQSQDAWLPAMVQSFNTTDGTYNLDVREHVHPDRIRARSMLAGKQGQPTSVKQSLTGQQGQPASSKQMYASKTTCPPPPMPSSPWPSMPFGLMSAPQTTAGMVPPPSMPFGLLPAPQATAGMVAPPSMPGGSLPTYPGAEEDATPSIRAIHSTPLGDEVLVAVVVTICSGSSFDALFSQVPQVAGEGQRIATYAVSEGSLPFIAGELSGQPLQRRCPTDMHRSLRRLLADISAVQPDSVVFNWECCSGLQCEHFHNCSIVMPLVRRLLDRGHMVMFSDFSLKALIQDWREDLLGPNPFVKTGEVNSAFKLRFDPRMLRACPSAQLQKLGELAEDGKAALHAMSGTIVFSVNWQKADSTAYNCQVLTVMTELDGRSAQAVSGQGCEVGRHRGQAGHVLLSYPSGGQLLASAGHWVELSRLDVTEAQLLEVAASYGAAYQNEIQASMASCTSTAERKQAVQSYSSQIVQQSPPCSLAPRPFPKSAPAAML